MINTHFLTNGVITKLNMEFHQLQTTKPMQIILVPSAFWWFFIFVIFKIELRRIKQCTLGDSVLIPLDIGRKRKVHKTFRGHLGYSIYVLCSGWYSKKPSYVLVLNLILSSLAFKQYPGSKILDETPFKLFSNEVFPAVTSIPAKRWGAKISSKG